MFQLKAQHWLTGLVIFLALLMALSIGFGLGKKTQTGVENTSVGQPTDLSIARGTIQSVNEKEIVLDLQASTGRQTFKLAPETKVTLIALPKINFVPFPATGEAKSATVAPAPPMPPTPPQPQEIKISDLKIGEDASLVYKTVGGDLVVQSITITQETQ